jgi:flavin reductase (DIM6/NTAB) family NADH-FMN oxidoreductase RutF
MADSVQDPRLFRDTMGRFATGVTVLTFTVGGEVRGMTANSFTSLSLDPPLLLVCIGKDVSTYAIWEQAKSFVVNILASDQKAVSDVFARHGAPPVPESGVAYHLGALGLPVLDGTLAHAECRISERIDGGDHTIVVGRAVSISIDRPDDQPLLFFSGKYRTLAPAG